MKNHDTSAKIMRFGLNNCPGSYNKPSAAW